MLDIKVRNTNFCLKIKIRIWNKLPLTFWILSVKERVVLRTNCIYRTGSIIISYQHLLNTTCMLLIWIIFQYNSYHIVPITTNIFSLTMVLTFCVEFRELSHLTGDLSLVNGTTPEIQHRKWGPMINLNQFYLSL